MVVAGFLFTAGAIVMAVAPNLGCMFAGRVILGFGVGAGTMVRKSLKPSIPFGQGLPDDFVGLLAVFQILHSCNRQCPTLYLSKDWHTEFEGQI